MDRFVWIRRNSNNSNTNSDSDATPHWWPAVYCESHTVAVCEFGDRMTVPMKMQAAKKTQQEETTKTCIPCVVPLTGQGSPVIHLEAVAVVDKSNESKCLRRDFAGSSYLMDFAEQYERNNNDTNNENDGAYQACLQELEGLLEETFLRVQDDIVETVEQASSLPVVKLRTIQIVEKLLTRRRLFQQSALAEERGDVSQSQSDLFLPPIECLTASWEAFWHKLECDGKWALRTGGKPYLFIKPGRNSIPGESKVGVDYYDNKADMQAYAREHYGWRGSDGSEDADNDNKDDFAGRSSQDNKNKKHTKAIKTKKATKTKITTTAMSVESIGTKSVRRTNIAKSIRMAGKTPPNPNTQVVATPSPSKVKVKCPICKNVVTTYSCQSQDRDPLPLTSDGIAAWDQEWPRPRARNLLMKARKHFEEEHGGVDLPYSISMKYKKRGSLKHPDGTPDYRMYKRFIRSEMNASENAN